MSVLALASERLCPAVERRGAVGDGSGGGGSGGVTRHRSTGPVHPA